jgi:hypothetical protein
VGDFIAKYELLSGLGVVVITVVASFLVRRVWRRARVTPPAAPGAPLATVNATLAARKHDIYDELLHLMHEATGRIVHLYGLRQEPLFSDWSLEQLDAHMTGLGFPGKTKAAILASWNTDQPGALKSLREIARQGEIAEAERALVWVGNYLLDKAPYIAKPISVKAREAFVPLKEILGKAKFPDPGGKGHLISGWTETAAARVEELAELIRAEFSGDG